MAIMMTNKLQPMLNVNRMSNNKGGSGITNMAMINNTMAGKPRPA
jgi:hypothetical protein